MYDFYIYALVLVCIVTIVLARKYALMFKDQSIIMIGIIWYAVLLEINFINMIVMIHTYQNSINKVGKRGPKGDIGPIGKSGNSFMCNQCGLAGKKLKPIYSTNINDLGEKVDNKKIRTGKCVFPFMHNNLFSI